MKKGLTITLLIWITAISSFAQTKSWGTKNIGQWTFENFPLHYYIIPSKTLYSKNSITGKLENYFEYNQLGQSDGLSLTMRSDGIYPSSATYTYNGEVVYIVSFFPASKTAQSITNYNKDGVLDGYKIYRELKSSGGFTEESEKYDNGSLVEINGVKQTAASSTYNDSLLNGEFKFEKNAAFFVIEGEAENGKLKRIKQASDGKYSIRELTFSKDSFTVRVPSQSNEGQYSYETYHIISNPTITNSKANCLKYGNYNGFPFLFIPNDFNISNLEEIIKKHHPEPLETKADYVDNLLNGDFQYREYIFNNGNFLGSYIDVFGKAEKGKLLNISLSIIEMNTYDGKIKSNKKIEYIFQDNKIVQNDYVPQISSEPVATKMLELEYPVLLTCSSDLGGTLSFYENNTTYNTLGVPLNRNARLEGNKYGYVYFSPQSFDVKNFITIVTTKTPRPVERNINEINSLIDGEFEFKQDRVHFVGTAKSGIIQKLEIIFDFENTKYTDGSNKACKYDIMELTLNGETYSASYSLSSSNQICYQETISFTKNKKLTSSIDMAGYDNFIYYSSDYALRGILLDLKFIEIQ